MFAGVVSLACNRYMLVEGASLGDALEMFDLDNGMAGWVVW